MEISVEDALMVLHRAGWLSEVRPNMGKSYPNLGVRIENEGDEPVVVMVLKGNSWNGYH